MAKQKYENKQVISICGVIEKDDNNEYIVTVEDSRDTFIEYSLNEILDMMLGNVITLSSDINIIKE